MRLQLIMCKQCLEAAIKYYPNLKEKEIGDLLMNATAFPFGSPELIEKQIVELKEKTDGTLDGAISFAAKRINDETMCNRKKSYVEEHQN